MFYGYNPVYLVSFLFIWFYSIEERSQELVKAYLDILGQPIALAPDYLPISQNFDWS